MITAFINIGNIEGIILLLLIVVPALYLLFTTIREVVTAKYLTGTQKILWFLIILHIPILGCIGFTFLGKQKRKFVPRPA